jgi:hypothetical protein
MVDIGKEAANSDIYWTAVSSVTLYLGGLLAIFILLLLYHMRKDLNILKYFFDIE